MPKVSIQSANSGEREHKEAHERMHGPWDDWEIGEASRHLERAEKIKENPKFMEAIAKHHEEKAKHHRELATEVKHHMQRGLVSEKALHRASEKGA